MQWSSLERRFLRQLPNPGNDALALVRIVNDFRQRRLELLESPLSLPARLRQGASSRLREPRTGIGIMTTDCERLVDFMAMEAVSSPKWLLD